MDRKQDAILTKGKRILLVFVTYFVIVNTISKFKASVERYTNNIGDADTIKKNQAKNIKGYAIQKETFKENSISAALKLSKVACIYAKDINDPILAEEMKTFKSDFDLRDELCLSKLENVRDSIKLILEEMLEYGITPVMFDDFVVNVSGFGEKIDIPANAIGGRHNQTVLLEAKLEESELELHGKIEGFMDLIKDANPEFYNEFVSANKDTILGSHKKKIPGTPVGYINVTVKNKKTGDAVADCLLKLVGDEEIYITSKTGQVTIESDQGEQIGQAMAINYNPADITANVTDKVLELVILLVPMV